MFRGLYGISDEVLTPYEKIFEILSLAIEGGLKIFQFRDKNHSDEDIFDLCVKIQDFCIQNNILFVINDRVKLACQIGAKALHIGSQDCSLKEARKNFGGKIGISCYDSLDLAFKAQEEGADYIAFGAFFDSKTKPNAPKAPLEIIEQAKQKLHIPICAIGGIDKNNVSKLKDVEMIAVIGGLWKGNITKNAECLLKNWKGNTLSNSIILS